MSLHDNECEDSTEDCCCMYRKEIAALTKERDDAIGVKKVAFHHYQETKNQLAASQAREAKLHEILDCGRTNGFLNYQVIDDLNDIPADDTALQQRLADERERCAVVCDKYMHNACADEIRSMK